MLTVTGQYFLRVSPLYKVLSLPQHHPEASFSVYTLCVISTRWSLNIWVFCTLLLNHKGTKHMIWHTLINPHRTANSDNGRETMWRTLYKAFKHLMAECYGRHYPFPSTDRKTVLASLSDRQSYTGRVFPTLIHPTALLHLILKERKAPNRHISQGEMIRKRAKIVCLFVCFGHGSSV